MPERGAVNNDGGDVPLTANACPPEDVGGVPGYTDFLEAVNDASHVDHARMVQWCGGPFDSAAFDLEEVNQRLMEIRF